MFRAIIFAAVIVCCLSNPLRLDNSKSQDRIENIFGETRQQANNLKSTLKKLSSHGKASRYMKRIFASGECIHSVDEAIDAIESGTKIIEDSEPGLRSLIRTMNSIKNPSDIVQVTSTSAELLRQMEILMPRLTPSKLDICGSSFDATFETMKSVGDILNVISEDQTLGISKLTRLQMKQSRVIVDSVNTFLAELNIIFKDLKTQCSSHQGYNVKSLKAIGKMLEKLGELFMDLGEIDTAKDIQEGASFTQKVVKAIENFPEVEFGDLDCNSHGNFETTARMLEDLVKLIQEIGLDKLKKQIGLEGLI